MESRASKLCAAFAAAIAIWLVAWILLTDGWRADTGFDDATWRFALGDDPAWSRVEFDDREWREGPAASAPRDAGPFWARTRISLPPKPVRESSVPGLKLSAAATSEVFWDGRRIGGSGAVGSSAESEEPGPIDSYLPVPKELTGPGDHLLAVRFSAFRRTAGTDGLLLNARAGDLRHLIRVSLRSSTVPLVFLGGLLLLGVYFGALAVGRERRAAHACAGGLCLAVAALAVAEAWRTWIGYDYPFHGQRLLIVELATAAVCVLLVAAFGLSFQTKRYLWACFAVASAAWLSAVWARDHEVAMLLVFAVGLCAALWIGLDAAVAQERGARFALIGVAACLACLVVWRRDFLDEGFFPAFAFLLTGLLISMAARARDSQERTARLQVVATRLEAELLKRHLQPHFLMNTLTTILEWVETDPPRGARAIQALSDELRALSDLVGESQVSMEQELRLCRAHLEVMGQRRGVRFELVTEGVDLRAPIPPALVHTLVENAVSHNAYREGCVRFQLQESRTNGNRVLELRTPLMGAPIEARADGGGLRYVKLRLEESAGDRWKLESGPRQGHWVTRITWRGAA